MKTFELSTKYIKATNCRFIVSKYQEGGLALSIYGHCGTNEYCEPLMDVTIFDESFMNEQDIALVKDYSENEGLADSLVQLGFAKLLGCMAVGFATVMVMRFDMDKVLQYGYDQR